MYCPVGKKVPLGLPLATVAVIEIDESVKAPMKTARKRAVLILPDIWSPIEGMQFCAYPTKIPVGAGALIRRASKSNAGAIACRHLLLYGHEADKFVSFFY